MLKARELRASSGRASASFPMPGHCVVYALVIIAPSMRSHPFHPAFAKLIHTPGKAKPHSSAHLLSRTGISLPSFALEPSASAFQAQYSPRRISAYDA